MRDSRYSSTLEPPRSSRRHAAAIVPPCRCAGRCHCGGLVPMLLLRELELECEFYRNEL